jgi:hypothetical protein
LGGIWSWLLLHVVLLRVLSLLLRGSCGRLSLLGYMKGKRRQWKESWQQQRLR